MTETGPGGGLSTSDQLGVERTRLAHDRTLMANVRTSTALITFGFTMYKFFSEMAESGRTMLPRHPLGARNFAFLMMTIGIIYLVLSSLTYMQQMKQLRERYGASIDKLPLALAAMVSILGVIGLLAILFRQ
ncbi:MAG TPA: DUF202 domain-containing protein [Candidatus Angelobacter sp.]